LGELCAAALERESARPVGRARNGRQSNYATATWLKNSPLQGPCSGLFVRARVTLSAVPPSRPGSFLPPLASSGKLHSASYWIRACCKSASSHLRAYLVRPLLGPCPADPSCSGPWFSRCPLWSRSFSYSRPSCVGPGMPASA